MPPLDLIKGKSTHSIRAGTSALRNCVERFIWFYICAGSLLPIKRQYSRIKIGKRHSHLYIYMSLGPRSTAAALKRSSASARSAAEAALFFFFLYSVVVAVVAADSTTVPQMLHANTYPRFGCPAPRSAGANGRPAESRAPPTAHFRLNEKIEHQTVVKGHTVHFNTVAAKKDGVRHRSSRQAAASNTIIIKTTTVATNRPNIIRWHGISSCQNREAK